MYCSACGQPMDASQTTCQRCGRQSAPMASYAPVASVAYQSNRVHRHMQALAILWIGYSLWILLHWAIAVGVLSGALTHWAHHSRAFGGFDEFPFFHAAWLVPLITVFLVGRAILCLVTGIGLLRRASWARILALVAAFLALIHPIGGTILGIYTLWVLLPAASGQEYEQMLVA
jgi:hypothetical protein